MKSIPVEKIDALIASLESYEEYGLMECRCGCSDPNTLVVETLRGLEKESEEMIPLSAVESKIKRLDEILPTITISEANKCTRFAIRQSITELKELTKGDKKND